MQFGIRYITLGRDGSDHREAFAANLEGKCNERAAWHDSKPISTKPRTDTPKAVASDAATQLRIGVLSPDRYVPITNECCSIAVVFRPGRLT